MRERGMSIALTLGLGAVLTGMLVTLMTGAAESTARRSLSVSCAIVEKCTNERGLSHA